MFTRHKKLSLPQRAGDFLWPRMGFKRLGRYYKLRLIRLEDTAHQLSIGLASGAAISFTPLPGTHIIGAMGLTWMLRGNVLAAALGTLLGNPWTLPIFWWLSYIVGESVFRSFGFSVQTMPPHFSLDELWFEVLHHPLRLILPWVSGGFILMVLTWPVFYFVSHWLIEHLRRNR